MKRDPFQPEDIVKHKRMTTRLRGVVERYDERDNTVKVKWEGVGSDWEHAKDIILLERKPIITTDSF